MTNTSTGSEGMSVRPLGGNHYGVKELDGPDTLVAYQPANGWTPELALCQCRAMNWPEHCSHVKAVIEFRRREGDGA
jgi:hypothetical protein